MHVTKARLGANYVVGTGIVLGVLLLFQLLTAGPRVQAWTVLGLLPALGLVSAVYWLPWLSLDSEGIWTVAQWTALGLGVLTVVIGGLLFASTVFSTVSVVPILASNVAAGALGGGLVGVACEQRRSNQRLSVRNAVLSRVLRHNLRNDMTVIVGHLDRIKRDVDETHHEDIEIIEQRLDALVTLTDKIRRLDLALDNDEYTQAAVDLVAVIEERCEHLAARYPGLEFTTDFPPTAQAYADDLFDTVLDNVVESALVYGDEPPTLHVGIEVGSEWIHLRIEDDDQSLPDQDLAAVAGRAESDLDHGYGIELWLVHWLVEAAGGRVNFECTAGGNVVEICLPRANEDPTTRFRGYLLPGRLWWDNDSDRRD